MQTLDESLAELKAREAELKAREVQIEQEQAKLKPQAREELSKVVKQIEKLEERKLMLEAFLGTNKPLGESPDAPKRRNIGTMKKIVDIVRQHPNGLAARDVLDIISREKLPIKSVSVSSALSYAFDKGLVTRDANGVDWIK